MSSPTSSGSCEAEILRFRSAPAILSNEIWESAASRESSYWSGWSTSSESAWPMRRCWRADTPFDLAAALLTASPAVAEPRSDVGHHSAEVIESPTSARTIIEALEWHADRNPGRVHIHLREDAGADAPVTYGHLWRESIALANGLRARGTRALRHRPPSCSEQKRRSFRHSSVSLLAGCIPVPIYPPFRADRIEEYAQASGQDPAEC